MQEDHLDKFYNQHAETKHNSRPCPECKGTGGGCEHGLGVKHVVSCGTYKVCPNCNGTGVIEHAVQK